MSALLSTLRQPEFWIPALCGTLLGCATLGGSFVFDSRHLVLENDRLDSLGQLPGLFLDNYWGSYAKGGLYRPVPLISFGVERLLFGDTAWPYHMNNALLYGAVCGLLGLFVSALGARRSLAVGFAVLFAAHPIHTEPVANLVGRAELFALLGGLGLLWGARRGTTRSSLAGIVLFAIGVFSKESAIAAVGVLALLGLFEPGASNVSLFERWISGLRKRAVLWIGVLAVLVVWFGLRSAALDTEPSPPLELNNALAERPTAARIAGGLEVSLRYHRMALAPWPLSADYSLNAIQPTGTFGSTGAIAGLVMVLFLGGAFAWSVRRGAATDPAPGVRLIGVGILLYSIPLAIVANIFFPTGTIFAERLLFAPSAGLCLIGAGLLSLARPELHSRASWVVIPLALIGGALFVIRCGDWRTEQSIARSITEVQPESAKGHEKLGHELYVAALKAENREARRALLHRAATSLERAIAIHEPYGDAHYNLSLVNRRRGRRDEWIAGAQRRHELESSYNSALGLARVYLDSANAPQSHPERTRAALTLSESYLRNPAFANSADFLRTKAESLMYLGRPTLARPILIALAKSDPDDLTLAPLLGLAHAMTGDLRSALREFDRVIAATPDHPQYSRVIDDRPSHLKNRARVHRELGDPEKAAADTRRIRAEMEAKIQRLLTSDGADAARRFLDQNEGFLDPGDREAVRSLIPGA